MAGEKIGEGGDPFLPKLGMDEWEELGEGLDDGGEGGRGGHPAVGGWVDVGVVLDFRRVTVADEGKVDVEGAAAVCADVLVEFEVHL